MCVKEHSAIAGRKAGTVLKEKRKTGTVLKESKREVVTASKRVLGVRSQDKSWIRSGRSIRSISSSSNSRSSSIGTTSSSSS